MSKRMLADAALETLVALRATLTARNKSLAPSTRSSTREWVVTRYGSRTFNAADEDTHSRRSAEEDLND